MSSSRDEHRRQPDPDRDTAGPREGVKPRLTDQRAEPSPVRDEESSSAGLWEAILERENLNTALKQVERNGGAPGIDGMTTKELRPYLKEHWGEIRAALDQQTYQPSRYGG